MIATVATAAIGVVVASVLGGWLSDDDEQRSPPPPPFPQTRLIDAQRIGLYRIEAGADAEDAMRALGQPSARETPHPTTCEATWERLGVRMRFANFGARDPCLYGTFCNARINGDEWGTTRGLQVGEPVSRMRELYPRAEQVRESGAIIRFVLEPGAQPCGPDAKGGLEAWTASGRIISLVVSLAAGGD